MIYETRISEHDLFGRIIIGIPKAENYHDYYSALDIFMPLLRKSDLGKTCTGFYINQEKKSIRISYFCKTTQRQKLLDKIHKIIHESILKEIFEESLQENVVIANDYGGKQYETRFRRYLSMETKIGLDLIETNSNRAKALAATYRWQVFPTNGSIRTHFEPHFKELSLSYNFLTKAQQEAFWSDFSLWPNPPQVDWAHLFINLILGFDCHKRRFYEWPFNPLSIEEINSEISSTGIIIDGRYLE
jgi:hypothetical protein